MQRLIWEGRMGQERSEVFVPGGRESTLKWMRAEVPQLRPRMLDAGPQRGASWEQLVLLDALHSSLRALDRAGILAYLSHALQLFLRFFLVVDKIVSLKR